MELKKFIKESDDDLYWDFYEYENLNLDPQNMDLNELRTKTAILYGVKPEIIPLSLNRDRLTEMYWMKANYKSISIIDAFNALGVC